MKSVLRKGTFPFSREHSWPLLKSPRCKLEDSPYKQGKQPCTYVIKSCSWLHSRIPGCECLCYPGFMKNQSLPGLYVSESVQEEKQEG